MRNLVAGAALLLAIAACAGTVRGPREAPMSVKEIVDLSKPAIVRVESVFANGGKGVGTGFIVGKDGRIITNLHVIVDVEHGSGPAVSVSVTLLDGTKHKVSKVVDFDHKRDLAVLAIQTGWDLPVLKIGDSDRISTGERVVAIGNPLGVLDYTVSDGLISSVRVLNDELTMIQISAPISQGSSGGPLFNNHGEVIGVATAFFSEGQNLNFGIPSNYLKPLLAHRGGKSLTELREALREQMPRPGPQSPPPGGGIQRKVPDLPIGILDGCPADPVAKVFHAIGKAIQVGAPLYNQGDHEACYNLYAGTALMVERNGWCKPLADALLDGIKRADGLTSFTEKAWAMRDAFDGVLIAIGRKIEAGGYPKEPFESK